MFPVNDGDGGESAGAVARSSVGESSNENSPVVCSAFTISSYSGVRYHVTSNTYLSSASVRVLALCAFYTTTTALLLLTPNAY